ncbi:MAG: DNA polymerase IV [Bacillota bacterium]
MEYDILLCDLDAFFASVEQRDNPELRDKPVIVGGRPEHRGVVSTCSYQARAFGVRSAMPMSQAIRLCPHAIVLPGNMRKYQEISRQVTEIYAQYACALEAVSIDEAYIAVPAGLGKEIGYSIRSRVREELRLPVSVGVSVNKLLAKIACGLAKPDGIRCLFPGQVEEVLWPMPVEKLPGVGPSTAKRLHDSGIRTIGQLAQCSAQHLRAKLGKFGPVLHMYAHGIDDRPLEAEREARSISEEMTFPEDKHDPAEVIAMLALLSEEVGFRLRKYGLWAKTVTLKLRFSDFSTITRSKTLSEPVNTDSTIYHVARQLFVENKGRPPWRLAGVQASNLVRDHASQITMLHGQDELREERLARAADELRKKYGRPVLHRAGTVLLAKGERSASGSKPRKPGESS